MKCYVHSLIQKSTKEYSIKEITRIVRQNDKDSSKIIYLKIKAFVLLDKKIEIHIKKFEREVNLLVVMVCIWHKHYVIGQTIQAVKNVDGKSVLDFLVKENLGEKELKDFQIIINTNAEETVPGKYILKLDDISLISGNRPNAPKLVPEGVYQEDLHYVQKEIVLHFCKYLQQPGNPELSSNPIPSTKLVCLTIHKSQGLTIPKVTFTLGGSIFSTGQAYVALSRCPKWSDVDISHLDRSTFMTGPDVILEY
ncbi:ATP-dependent DNA helicase Pif1-like [Rhizophagus clarus]|uniref:ATP-dependent DNA helicase Pif1-like n=1 Tax=Rhizophagus clarus TaxID=94130 RepID=A0A8H3LNF6_9GLOM|nr:ATP-dependent DNA helicase Pif1-like [Rhizophagus clarus]